MKTRIHRALNLLPIGFCLLLLTLFTASPSAVAQGDTVTLSAGDFQRLVYSAYLHTQLALKPELEASLRVLLEMHRHNPQAAPASLAGLLSSALQVYSNSAPYYIRTKGYPDEVLATYLDALRQVPARTNFNPINLTMLNNFMLGPADYNSNVAPATLFLSLVDSGHQRLFSSEGQALKRQALVDECVTRAHANGDFAAAMDGVLANNIEFSLATPSVTIISEPNSPLCGDPTMTNLLSCSLKSVDGSVTVTNKDVMDWFTQEMRGISDTIHTNLAVATQVNQRQPDPQSYLAYLTNQAALDADSDFVAAVQQDQPVKLASATAAVLVQSKLMPVNTGSAEIEQTISAFGSIAIGVGGLCAKDPCALESVLSGSLDVFNMFTGAQSPKDNMAAQISNIQTMIGDLSTNMNYRFDRVDQSLTNIFETMNRQFDHINISFDAQLRQIAKLNGSVSDIRSTLVDVQTNLNRLEQDVLLDFQTGERNQNLIGPANNCLFYEVQNPGFTMTWRQYADSPGYEGDFYNYAASYAADQILSPSQSLDLAESHLEQQLAARPLDANLNYIAKYLFSNLGQDTLGSRPLANPEEWFMGAYAYLQLATENPMLFRQKGAGRVSGIIGQGQSVADFCGSLTFKGTNINWNLINALEAYYFRQLTNFNAKVSSAEADYETETNFALSTWRQWYAAAPRVTATNTAALVVTPKNLISEGEAHSLMLKPDGTVVAWGDNTHGQTTIPAGLENVVQVAGGAYHSAALKSDGTVVVWGDNSVGETNIPAGLANVIAISGSGFFNLALKADGTVVGWGDNTLNPTNVLSGLSGVVAIAAGLHHCLALKANGTVVGWGDNDDGEATGVPDGAPGMVLSGGQALSNVVAIAVGNDYSLALQTDGTVVGWGENKFGQATGTPNTNSPYLSSGPVTISGQLLTDVVAIAAGARHSLALKADGTVVGWGQNLYGEATGTPNTIPLYISSGVVTVSGQPLAQVVAIAAGAWHSLALKADGTIIGWGNDTYGQNVPRPGVPNLPIRNHVAAGQAHGLVLKADGRVVGWGKNDQGQTNAPPNATNVLAVAAGWSHSLALRDDGIVVCWGENQFGQAPTSLDINNVVAIAAGGTHSLGLRPDGRVYAWGSNDSGEATGGWWGTYYFHPYTSPGVVQDLYRNDVTNVVALAAGLAHSLALLADGRVYGWGFNYHGEANSVPTSATSHYGNGIVPGLSNVVAIAGGWWHSLALKTDGTILGWGDNSYGQVTGVANGPRAIVSIGGYNLTNAAAIAVGGSHSLALKADGTVVGWGQNDHGEATGVANGPPGVVAVGGQTLRNVVAIAASETNSFALLADGTIIEWGDGGAPAALISPQAVDLSALGHAPPDLGDVPSVSSPITALAAGSAHSLALTASGSVVGWGLNTWGQASVLGQATKGVQAVAAGLGHNLALTTNGAVLAWGLNDSHQTDVPVDALSRVVAISAGAKHNLALNADGMVMAWGLNGYGQGDVPGPFGTNVFQGQIIAIAAGGEHSLVLKADGTVVGWGNNDDGQATGVPLGPCPNFVAASGQILSTAVAIAAGRYYSLALKSDGTVVGWGYNHEGQATGVPDAPPGSVVINGQALSEVVAIAAGFRHSLALKRDGTVVVWGSGPPTFLPAQGWTNVVAIAAGDQHSVLLRANTSSGVSSTSAQSLLLPQIPFARVALLLQRGNDYVRDATAVQNAGTGLSGAKLLLTAVLQLGMPYTLERDGILNGLLYGSQPLMDLTTTTKWLENQNEQLQARPDMPPQALPAVDVLPFIAFQARLEHCLANLQATGQPEIPRLVGHTLRLLNQLRDAWTPTTNTPPPALELVTLSNTPSLVLHGEPYVAYGLQYSDTLRVPNWTDTTITGWQDGQAIALPYSGGSQRYYRAVTLLPPMQ